jgi:signal peptidase II
MLGIVLGVALIVIVIDQVTKYLAVLRLRPRIESGEGPVPIIGQWFMLSYVENTGAAFSIGTGYTWIFTIIACVVVVVILRTSRKIGSVWWAVALGGLLGGATGNLIDRLTRPPGIGRGYVVDFLALPNFPVFNVADMAVVGSAGLMIGLSIFGVEYTTGRRR